MAESKDWVYQPLPWAAGFAGSLAASIVTAQLSLKQRIATIVVGLLTAGFLTGPVVEGVRLADSTNMVGLVGFLLGLTGITLAVGVVQLATKFRDDPIGTGSLVWRFWRGQKPGGGP